MTGNELVQLLRSNLYLRDNVAPYLWSDAELLHLLNEGAKEYAKKTHAILDDSLSITTEIGVSNYQLDPTVIYVYSARESTQWHDMENYTRRFLPGHLDDVTGGMPTVFTTDEAANTIRFYAVPDDVYVIKLRAARLPKLFDFNSSPEMPYYDHEKLCSYAAYKALISNDVDASGTSSALRHREDWNAHVADAKREIFRIRNGNNLRVINQIGA